MTHPTFLVLQHITCEPPAAYEDELAAWDATLHRVMVDQGEPLPDWNEFAGIIAMGGPMGACEDDRLPWLVAERRLIGDAVRAGKPYWGVCPGAQLLAASLGAQVYAGPQPEVGVLPVFATPAASQDPVAASLPSEFMALQWHADTFHFPPAQRGSRGQTHTSNRHLSCTAPTASNSTLKSTRP